MAFDYALEELESLRDVRYRRTPELHVRTEDEALCFINEAGYCYLFGDHEVEIPTLWAAICGSRREVPGEHFDREVGLTWEWKDTLPTRGAVFYGKLLRGKPTLVSLGLLPHFYALSPNYGDIEDYLEQYAEGRLSVEARNIYEALLKEGAMATSRLRQVSGLAGGGANARRFDRALAELQGELKIVKVGISDANRWGYAYVYDLFLRRFPDIPQQARAISTDEAMQRLLLTYLRNVIAQPEGAAKRLFRWDEWEWERLLTRLAERSAIRRDVRVEGSKELHLAESRSSDV